MIRHKKRIRGGSSSSKPEITEYIYDLLIKNGNVDLIKNAINVRKSDISNNMYVLIEIINILKQHLPKYERMLVVLSGQVISHMEYQYYHNHSENIISDIDALNKTISISDRAYNILNAKTVLISYDTLEKNNVYKILKKEIDEIIKLEYDVTKLIEERKKIEMQFVKITANVVDYLNKYVYKPILVKENRMPAQRKNNPDTQKSKHNIVLNPVENAPNNTTIAFKILYLEYIKKIHIDKKNKAQIKEHESLINNIEILSQDHKNGTNNSKHTNEELIVKMLHYLITYLPLQKNKTSNPSHANKFINKISKDKKMKEEEIRKLIDQMLIDAGVNLDIRKISEENIHQIHQKYNYSLTLTILYTDYVKKYPIDKKNNSQKQIYDNLVEEMNKRTNTDEKVINDMLHYLITYLPVQKNKTINPSHANKFINKISKDKKMEEKEIRKLIDQTLIDAGIDLNFNKSSIKNILIMISIVILGIILLVTGLYFVGVLVAYIMASKRYTHEETKNKAIYSWLFVFTDIS